MSADQFIMDLKSESKVIRSRAAKALCNLKFEGEEVRKKVGKALKHALKDLDEATQQVVTETIENLKKSSKSK